MHPLSNFFFFLRILVVYDLILNDLCFLTVEEDGGLAVVVAVEPELEGLEEPLEG